MTKDEAMAAYVGSRLKNFRKQAGLSRTEAAKKLKITDRTLAAYERGERVPTMVVAYRILATYHISFSDFIGCD